MARIIATQQQGALLDLRGPQQSTLHVVAPDGLEVRIPAPRGKATIWLPQAGEWTYTWTDGTTGTITVTSSPEPATPLVKHKVTGPRWN